MATKKVEDSIRAYLDSLGRKAKPSVDREAVKALREQVRSERDPLAKLRLLAALNEEQAGRVQDDGGDRAVFVAEAKAWADAEGVPASAFQALKVPDDVLTEAGFTVTAGRGGSRRGGSRRSGSGTRAPQVPTEDVLAAARKLGRTWKLADLASALGREPTTVRNYVNKLVGESKVTVVGDDPEHDGRGRAAKVYATS